MKKSIITLLALSGLAMGETETISFESPQAYTPLAGYGAVDIKLGETSWLTNDSVNYTTATGLKVSEIYLSMYSTWYTKNNMTTGFGIGIYEKGESNWTLIGKTAWFQHTADSYVGDHGFEVEDGTTLEIGKTYTLAFHAGKDFFDSLSTGTTRDDMTGATEWNGTQPNASTADLAAVGLRGTNNVVEGKDVPILYHPGDVEGYTKTQTPFMKVSGTLISTPAIPEPTTATLSLLALAGLAARRRRR